MNPSAQHFFVYDDPSDEEICRECGVTRDRVESSMHTSDCPGEDTMLLEKLDAMDAMMKAMMSSIQSQGKAILAIQARLRRLEVK